MSSRSHPLTESTGPDLSVEPTEVVLGLVGELDLWTAILLRRAVYECEATTIALDLTGVSFIDAAGLGCLVELTGLDVHVVQASRRVTHVCALVGLLHLLGDHTEPPADGNGAVRKSRMLGRLVGRTGLTLLRDAITRVKLPRSKSRTRARASAPPQSPHDGYRRRRMPLRMGLGPSRSEETR